MQKSIEDYRQELMDMASRGMVGGRELFAEDSKVEVTPSTPTIEQSIEPQTNPSETVTPQNPPSNQTANGTLVVVLTHSKGLFPVPNAKVCVSDSNGNSIGCKLTDSSGRTEEWSLPAPPKANSTSPGASASDVSSFYNIRIDADGYVPVIIEGVPVFDGIRTLQPLDMFFAGAAPSTAPEVIKFSNSYTL